MKTYLLLFTGIILASSLIAQSHSQQIKSEIQSVTVYLEGAEILRTKEVSLSKGENEVIFENLSPELDPQSIRLKSPGLTLLSISHNYNFLNENELREEVEKLKDKQEKLRREIDLLNTERSILQQEKEVLMANKEMGGQQGLDAESLRASMDYFREALGKLEKGLLMKNFEIAEKQRINHRYALQMNQISKGEARVRTEVSISLEASEAGNFPLALSYLVGECGWIPSYDIKAQSVDSPLQIRYHASIFQQTGIDWEGVSLTISSGNPSQNSTLPRLSPWRIGKNNSKAPNTTKRNSAYPTSFITTAQGRITDANGYPLEGVRISLAGTTISTLTDANGEYEIQMPEPNGRLTAVLRGYQEIGVNSSPGFKTTKMVPFKGMSEKLTERVLKAQAIQPATRYYVDGVKVRDRTDYKARRKTKKLIPMEKLSYQTNFSYKLQLPYSVNSDGKAKKITMVEEEIEVDYEYNSVPKLDEKAYLTTSLTDWGQYNFLSGQARLFFEDQYVGNSLLDTRYVNDTLRLSLGRDNNILIQRQKVKDYGERKFFGSKVRDSRAFEITILNNKQSTVQIRILDQIPISPNDNIKVLLKESSEANYTYLKGELEWKLSLKAGEKKVLRFSYEVEYPKNQPISNQLE
ncbi:MAG: DUF4139 domain-containing protein [Bacteroidia bacterium]|nr:DUF4139 domain-containing protein [Bacteroidia bacterium]